MEIFNGFSLEMDFFNRLLDLSLQYSLKEVSVAMRFIFGAVA